MKKRMADGSEYVTDLSKIGSGSNPRLSPATDILSDLACQHPVSSLAEIKELQQRQKEYLIANRLGRPVTRSEALAIAEQIMLDAEKRRKEYRESEAMKGDCDDYVS